MGMSFSPGGKWAAETHLEEIMSNIASVFWDKNYLRGWIQGLFLFWQKVAFGISSERNYNKDCFRFGGKNDLRG